MSVKIKELMKNYKNIKNHDYEIINKERVKKKKSNYSERLKKIHEPRSVILKDNSIDQYMYLQYLNTNEIVKWVDNFLKNEYPKLDLFDQSLVLYYLSKILLKCSKFDLKYKKHRINQIKKWI
jgi:hypothetical protein